MKEQVKFGVIYQVMVIGVVCIMLSSCSTYNKIYSDDDIVYSTKDLNSNITVKIGIVERLSISLHSQS